tara:strand:+ start:707 stop:1492 length:786 start_codon:yes stop_codon:yes gene_type:complete
MIYKKKHVIKESLIIEGLLIDDISNFSIKEKKILKTLYKKYYKPNDPNFRWWRLSRYDILTELDEKWLLPFNVAFKMSKIFVEYGEKLFVDNHIKTSFNIKEVFESYFERFTRIYKSKLIDGDRIGDQWDINVDNKVSVHDVHFWDSYDGFTLYSPINREAYWELPIEERNYIDNHLLLVRCKFKYKLESEQEPTLRLTYEVGKGDDVTSGVIVDEAIFDLPKEVSQTEMFVWFDDLINVQVRTIIEDFKFPPPPQTPESD